jgi:hypothetical protein
MRECKNVYVIDDTLVIRGYDGYINYYYKELRPRGLMTICTSSKDFRGRPKLMLKTVRRSDYGRIS